MPAPPPKPTSKEMMAAGRTDGRVVGGPGTGAGRRGASTGANPAPGREIDAPRSCRWRGLSRPRTYAVCMYYFDVQSMCEVFEEANCTEMMLFNRKMPFPFTEFLLLDPKSWIISKVVTFLFLFLMVFENCVYYLGPERKGTSDRQSLKSSLVTRLSFSSPSLPLLKKRKQRRMRVARGVIALSRIFLKNLSRERVNIWSSCKILICSNDIKLLGKMIQQFMSLNH